MQQRPTFKHIITSLLLTAAVLGMCTKAGAQINSYFKATLLNDSLVASNGKDFLYNNLTVSNTTSQKISMVITITAPGRWQLITDNIVSVTLEPNGSTIIPVRLLPGNGNTAMWEQVRLDYRMNTGETTTGVFSVKVQEYTKFKASIVTPSIVLPGYQRNIAIPVHIKNGGNVQATYTITSTNEFLHLDDKSHITLEGGADTTYTLPVALTENEFALLKKEDVNIVVTGNNETANLSATISKIGFVLKEHASAYADMPLQLEAGVLYQGNTTAPQYYGGIYGSVDLTSKDRIALSLRSDAISTSNALDNSLIKVDYIGKHIQASVGNIIEVSDFAMNGYGAKVAYNWDNNRVILYTQLKSRSGDCKVYGGAWQHFISRSIKLTSSAAAENDATEKVNSGIARQTVDAAIGTHAKISVVAGASLQQNNAAMVNNANNTIAGTSAGYNFAYTDKHLSVLSNVLYNSNNFAGIYKGQKSQLHDVRIIKKKFFFGGYYEYTYNKQNNFLDSILVSNFNIQTANYGVRAGYSGKVGSIVVSAGNQQQQQSGEGNNFRTSYNYINLNGTISIAKRISLNINSYAGEGAVASQHINNVFITSTQGALQVYNSGIAFRYDKGPFYYSDFSTYIQKPQDIERLMVSPYADMSFLHHTLNVRAQYNYMSAMPTVADASSMLLNVSYANPYKGYDFHVTGMLPVSSGSNVQPNISASVRVRLNAPCIAIKKYHSIKIFLFKDANSNGIKDANETAVAGQVVSIGGNLLISDANGMIEYKNVADSVYRADFGYSSKIKGWAPATGNIQHITVDGANATQYIAFRKSHVLQGSLKVAEDANSNLKFSTANIKVMVTTNDSTTYSTLTDANGEFYFNVPAGKYTVSLSPAAFDEHFRPTQFSQVADLTINDTKSIYFEVNQKKRQMNINKAN